MEVSSLNHHASLKTELYTSALVATKLLYEAAAVFEHTKISYSLSCHYATFSFPRTALARFFALLFSKTHTLKNLLLHVYSVYRECPI